MNRMVALVFALVLLLSLNFRSVLADESEKEILFRGNHWGSSLDAVKSSFPDSVIWVSPKPDASYSIMYHMTGTHKKYFDGKVCCYVKVLPSSLKNLKVAGYDVDYVQLRFAYVPSSNGLIDDNANNTNTALYYAEYRLNCYDAESAFDDLKSKLNDLYGDISVRSYPEYVHRESYDTWYGANGTMVTLKCEYSSGEKEIYIMYGFSGADDLLNKAYEALMLKEKMNSNANYEGL